MFEYLPHDLSGMISFFRQTLSVDPSQVENHGRMVKHYMRQILSGIHTIHCDRIMHRDLKPQNILADEENTLKIADFGLSRAFSVPLKPYTHEVVTVWYRAPELLLGAVEYTIAVDMWSIGCIFFELCAMKPLFAKNDPLAMIKRIFEILGTPSE